MQSTPRQWLLKLTTILQSTHIDSSFLSDQSWERFSDPILIFLIIVKNIFFFCGTYFTHLMDKKDMMVENVKSVANKMWEASQSNDTKGLNVEGFGQFDVRDGR